MKSDDEDEDIYSEDGVDYFVNQPSDLEDPMCGRCGSTKWQYCTLGENSLIKKCSDCPRRKDIH